MRMNHRLAVPLLVSCPLTLGIGATCAMANDAPESGDTTGENIPVVLVVPLEGQMGTDIHEEVIADIIEEALTIKPDFIVYKLESADFNKNYHLPRADQLEFGMVDPDTLTAYQEIVTDLQNQLSDSEQVVWVVDSVGVGSLLALSWCDMYMSPEARLWGLRGIFEASQGWADADVREKMEEAWEGIARGFLEMGCHGEYSRELGGALMDPEKMLSTDFKGREVVWRDDTVGTWVIDDHDERVAIFDARTAEDTLLSDGTAESLEDLMFLLGHREFQRNKTAIEVVDDYKEKWRRGYKKSIQNLSDIRSGIGGSNDALRSALHVKGLYEEILAYMRQFNAVERRLARERGLTMARLMTQIDIIDDQIKKIRNGRKGGGNTGGGSGGRTRGGPS